MTLDPKKPRSGNGSDDYKLYDYLIPIFMNRV